MSAATLPTSHTLPLPGILWGDYPERAAAGPGTRFDSAWNALRALAATSPGLAYPRFARRVLAHAEAIGDEAEEARKRRLQALRPSLMRHGLTETIALEAFALAALACRRTLGLTPYETQIAAARVMLDNRLAEMATGEGKTIAVALAAAVAALAGTPVHVVTANDYLAARDARTLDPFYRAVGLSVAAVTQPMERAARRAAYAADVAYCTAKELAFDYLRDGLARPRGLSDLGRRARRLRGDAAPPTVLRGLCMAIIDEADTVLLDEARMPLVLSQAEENSFSADFLAGALALARDFAPGTDFQLASGQFPTLTQAGADRVAAWHAGAGAYATQRRHREDAVCMALTALHVYQRDRHYVVRDAKVLIVDDNTGRAAPGRAWSRGLHQLVELKEACPPSPALQTVAQITFQRFFRRYVRLCGMSGTLAGAEGELGAVYGLPVVRIAPRLPSRRSQQPMRICADRGALWSAVAQRARAVHQAGRPLLIGTASVADSEQLSGTLAAAGLAHVVLNARFDQAEAEIVARAGEAGRITVATSMAGRGTDIRLGDGVAARGGLHVILCQHNGARRIDRQLIGRCARNGEPGSYEVMLSLDFPLLVRHLPARWRARAARAARLPAWLARLAAALPQWLEERRQCAERRHLARADLAREQELDFCQRTAS